jgi:hypothetical protein
MRITVNGGAKEIVAANLAEALVALDYADTILATAPDGGAARLGPDSDRDRIAEAGRRSGGVEGSHSGLIGTHRALCYM